MSTLGVGLLLLLAAVAFGVGLYVGTRRLARVSIRAVQAERRAARLEADAAQLHDQLGTEQAILERLPDPVVLLGPDRGVRRLNAAARDTLGSGIPALLRHPDFRTALERAGPGEHHVELSLPVPIARDLHVSVLRVGEADPTLAVVLSDRTRERAVERMRADFVANASHELRTPLTSLIGFIDTLRGPAADDPEAQARFLGIMAEQAQRMNRLIDSLLSLSRVELSEHVPPSGRVELPRLIERVAAGFSPMLAANRIGLGTELGQALPAVAGDEDQLGQVLQNLIENAIKYGREGGQVRVRAAAAPRAGQDGAVLTVRDDGPGIAAEHLPRLTERFYRVSTHRARAVGGTGLGLAIVKHIVNRHRGQLRIESTEGAGTCVTVWLPVYRAFPDRLESPGRE